MIYSLLKYQWVFHRSSNGTLKFIKVNKYTKKYPPTINPSKFPTCVPREEWCKMQKGSICKVHPTSLWQDGMKDYKMDIWTQTYISQSMQRPVSNKWYCDCVVSKLHCIQHKRHNSISNTLESESIYRTSIRNPTGDKTVLWPSFLHDGIFNTGGSTYLYWIRALELRLFYIKPCKCPGPTLFASQMERASRSRDTHVIIIVALDTKLPGYHGVVPQIAWQYLLNTKYTGVQRDIA